MPANEFEKEVQQKMEQLNLAPSDEVWFEVERRIRKEKKRRRFIIWFFLFGVLFLGGGIVLTKWSMNNKNNKHVLIDNNAKNEKSHSLPSQKKPENNIAEADSLSKTIMVKNGTTKYKINKTRHHEEKISRVDRHKILPPKNKLPNSILQQERKQYIQKEPSSEVVKNKSADENKRSEVQVRDEPATKINQQADTTLGDMAIENGGNKQMSQKKLAKSLDSSNNIVSLQEPFVAKKNSSENANSDSQNLLVQNIKDSIVIAASENKDSIKNKKTGKWKWGLMLQKGKSDITEKFKFLPVTSGAYRDNSSFLNGPSSSAGGQPVYPASPIHSSGSFAAGVFAQRPLSYRVGVNFGLFYYNLSTKRKVGNHLDSSVIINNPVYSYFSVDNFYASTNNNSSYTNHYHFLNLSAEISWLIIKSKNINISWNNGLMYSLLLASDALHFDQNLPGYYEDFNLFTKNHLFFTTSLSVPLFKKLIINPFTESAFTQVLNYKSSTKAHYTNYGLRIKFLLN